MRSCFKKGLHDARLVSREYFPEKGIVVYHYECPVCGHKTKIERVYK